MPPTLRKRTNKASPKTSPHFPKQAITRKRIKKTPQKILENTSPNSSPDTSKKTTPKPKRKATPKTSPHFPSPPKPPYHRSPNPSTIPQPPDLPFTLQPAKFGLIQERICTSLYALIVQSILWNQTRGTQARPILFILLTTYPTPEDLAAANQDDLAEILQPIGLHNIRAKRLIDMAQKWCEAPPCKERRYCKLHYPERGCGADVKPGDILAFDDEREAWEVAHLPGVGRYAIDSFRIFCRDQLRGLVGGEGVEGVGEQVEPEWKRVRAEDKDLKAYLKWMWEQDEKEGKTDRERS